VVKKGKEAKRTGTTVTFWPDPTSSRRRSSSPTRRIQSRMREMAFLNKGLEIRLRDEREDEPVEETFLYKGGIVDFVKHLNASREPIHKQVVYFEETSDDAEVEIAMQWTGGYTESVLSFANNINTHEGGTHEEGFRKAITRAINDFARSKGLSRRRTRTCPVRTSARGSPPSSP
jgi:DNA gyrase subunit B